MRFERCQKHNAATLNLSLYGHSLSWQEVSLYARLLTKLSCMRFKPESSSAAGRFPSTAEVVLHHLKRRHYPQLELPSKSAAFCLMAFSAPGV